MPKSKHRRKKGVGPARPVRLSKTPDQEFALAEREFALAERDRLRCDRLIRAYIGTFHKDHPEDKTAPDNPGYMLDLIAEATIYYPIHDGSPIHEDTLINDYCKPFDDDEVPYTPEMAKNALAFLVECNKIYRDDAGFIWPRIPTTADPDIPRKLVGKYLYTSYIRSCVDKIYSPDDPAFMLDLIFDQGFVWNLQKLTYESHPLGEATLIQKYCEPRPPGASYTPDMAERALTHLVTLGKIARADGLVHPIFPGPVLDVVQSAAEPPHADDIGDGHI